MLRHWLATTRGDIIFWRRKRAAGWSGAREELSRAIARELSLRAELSELGVPTW